jgi:SsrA-binding protein
MTKKGKGKKPAADGVKIVARNKQATHRYEIIEKLEAGLALRGTEVKSIRDGKVSIAEAFCRILDGEAWVVNMDIAPYSHAGQHLQHARKRNRKLLLNKREIMRLIGQTQEKELSIIPLALYFKKGRAKLEIAVVRGKKLWDKRDSIRKKEDRRSLRKMTHRR